jgi:hypothetical protein
VTRSKTSKQNNQTNGQSHQNQIVGGGGIEEDDDQHQRQLQQPQHLKLQQNQHQPQQSQQQQSEQQMKVIQQQHKQRQDMQDLFKEMTRLKTEMLQWPDFEPLQQQLLLEKIQEQLKLMQLHVNKMQQSTKQLLQQKQKTTFPNAILKSCFIIILIPLVLAVIGAILVNNFYVLNPSTPNTWTRHTAVDANVQQKLEGLKQDFPR